MQEGFVLSGVLSFDTVTPLLAEGQSLFASVDVVRVDLAAVELCDSAGVALLAEWVRLTRGWQKEIEYQNVPAQLLAIAELSGLDALLPFSK